jgi:hypothetical protein
VDKYNSVEEIIEDCKNKGIASWGDYYVEYKPDSLFEKGYAKLYKYAHPDSMSMNHLIENGILEELAWDLMLCNEPVETVWGNF